MDKIWMSIIYLGFFGLIGFAIWFTGSAMPLWALLLCPSMKSGTKDEIENN